METFLGFVYWLLLIFFAIVAVYILVRTASVAWFRSRLDHIRQIHGKDTNE